MTHTINALLLIGSVFVTAYFIHLIWALNEISGWSDEQSQRMLEELEQKGEELRKSYENNSR